MFCFEKVHVMQQERERLMKREEGEDVAKGQEEYHSRR